MIYGWCLLRIIHFIVSLRLANPNKSILIAKYDYSDAYRRISHSARAVVQTVCIVGTLAFVYLRLAFGGAPNPPTWCNFSEIVTDLANEISQCADWDPATLHSPDQPVTPTVIRMDKDLPFAPGRPMAVSIPTRTTSRVDGFIDDLINVFLDTEDNCRRQPHTVPLAMFVTSRPHAGNKTEPIPRRAILSLVKLEAEGSPAEEQIVLGWHINTRKLQIALPNDKYMAWVTSIKTIIKEKGCLQEEMETLIGQLNHAAYILPMTRHFLSRLRALKNSKSHRRSKLRPDHEQIADLQLWVHFLGSGTPRSLHEPHRHETTK